MPTLTIPESIHRQLAAKAAEQHTTIDDLAVRLLATDLEPPEPWLDTEFRAECENDTEPAPTLEEVRAILAKLPGSLAKAIIEDRDER